MSMTSSMVSAHRLKIQIPAEEWDEDRPLGRLIASACRQSGFSPGDDRLMVETLCKPDGGHTVCVTKLPGKRSSPNRRKQVDETEPYIFSFDTLDSLLAAGHAVLRHPEVLLNELTVLFFKGVWYLCFSPVLAGLDGYRLDCLLGCLCEFGKEEAGGRLRELRLRETGRFVASDEEAERLFTLTAHAPAPSNSDATAALISEAPNR